VARAKRTQRADARRRYRQTQLDAEADGGAVLDPAIARAAAEPAKPTSARPSFSAAFRLAYHRANVREDLPYLPTLIRHWSFWVPLLLMVASAILAAVAPSQGLVALAFQTFVFPPALIAMFIVGFFAARASYLLGGILGVANVIVYGGFLAYAGVGGLGTAIPGGTLQSLFVNAIFVSPASGVLFSALAAWYRRFLNLSNPNRGRRPPPKSKPKPNSSSGRPALKGR
jgi:hypothetical protein